MSSEDFAQNVVLVEGAVDTKSKGIRTFMSLNEGESDQENFVAFPVRCLLISLCRCWSYCMDNLVIRGTELFSFCWAYE